MSSLSLDLFILRLTQEVSFERFSVFFAQRLGPNRRLLDRWQAPDLWQFGRHLSRKIKISTTELRRNNNQIKRCCFCSSSERASEVAKTNRLDFILNKQLSWMIKDYNHRIDRYSSTVWGLLFGTDFLWQGLGLLWQLRVPLIGPGVNLTGPWVPLTEPGVPLTGPGVPLTGPGVPLAGSGHHLSQSLRHSQMH